MFYIKSLFMENSVIISKFSVYKNIKRLYKIYEAKLPKQVSNVFYSVHLNLKKYILMVVVGFNAFTVLVAAG